MLHRLPVDLTVPSLEALSYVLRHREHWPKGFEWDFRSCKTCAIGLAADIWQLVPDHYEVAPVFDIRIGDAEHLFMPRHISDYRTVTPEHVADQIDLYLAR